MTAEKEDEMIDDNYYLFRLGERVKGEQEEALFGGVKE